MRDFKELKVLQKAHHLALDVYGATQSFPANSIFKKLRADR